MPSPAERRVTGLVLAAGGSKRLGRPKQLLPYGRVPLLGHVIDTARECEFDQLLCVLGCGSDDVRGHVELGGVEVVENRDFGQGCSSSIAVALEAVDPRSDLLVLMLGDQPGVSATTVRSLLEACDGAPLAACAYEDGRGHPLVFARSLFGELGSLHGDKAVWKLLDQHVDTLLDVPIAGPVPRDVDTWADYAAVLEQAEVSQHPFAGAPSPRECRVEIDAAAWGRGWKHLRRRTHPSADRARNAHAGEQPPNERPAAQRQHEGSQHHPGESH